MLWHTELNFGEEAESLHPGDMAMCNNDEKAKVELFEMYPELAELEGRATSQVALRSVEGQAVLAD